MAADRPVHRAPASRGCRDVAHGHDGLRAREYALSRWLRNPLPADDLAVEVERWWPLVAAGHDTVSLSESDQLHAASRRRRLFWRRPGRSAGWEPWSTIYCVVLT